MSNVYPRTLAEEMAQWVREDQGTRFDQHPEPETLAAYHAGSLSPEKDLEIQQHLLLCPECPDLLLDLEDLFEPRHRDLDLSDSWVSAAWRDLQGKLVIAPGSKESFWRRWMGLFSAIPRPAHAMATAVLFVALAGSTMTTVRLRQDLRQAAAPFGALPSQVVMVASGTRGSEEERKPVKATRIEFKPQQKAFRLDLRVMSDKSYERIAAEISGWDSKEIYTIQRLEQVREPVVKPTAQYAQLTLLRPSLRPGRYEIQLTGFEDGKDEGSPLGKYPIEIVHL